MYSLISGTPIAHLLSHSWKSWLRAMCVSLRVRATFDQHGSVLARTWLPVNPMTDHLTPCQHATVHRDAARLRLWLHSIAGSRACYAESLAICAGLRSLGWRCATVIGYARMDMGVETDLHAWAECGGEPVLDDLDMCYCYQEVERV